MNARLGNLLLLPALVLSAVLPHLLDLGYRLMDFEVVVSMLALLAVAGVLAFILRNWFRTAHVLIGLLVYWLIDAYFAASPQQALLGLLVAILVLAGLHSRHAESLRAMLLTFCVVWLLGAAMAPVREVLPGFHVSDVSTNGKQHLPPIYHFIIDEQMSPLALPESIPDGHPAEHILDDYLQRGFLVYGKVHSRTEWTRYSISDLVSLGEAEQDNVHDGRHSEQASFSVPDNPYYRLLEAQGYQVTTLQSNYLDICNSSHRRACYTYSRANSGHALTRYPDSRMTRLQLMLLELHFDYMRGNDVRGVRLYRKIARALGSLDLRPDYVDDLYLTRPATVVEVLDQIEQRLQRPQRGQAYLFHLLLPHFPYLLDQQCGLKERGGWMVPNRHLLPSRYLPLASIYAGYWDQSSCLHGRLLGIIDKVLATPEGRDAIIMIHGDHGARVKMDDKTPGLQKDRDDLLQTFLVVRRDNLPSSLDEQPQVLQLLFGNFVRESLQLKQKPI